MYANCAYGLSVIEVLSRILPYFSLSPEAGIGLNLLSASMFLALIL